MSICKLSGLACDCQPDEGVPCSMEGDGLKNLMLSWRAEAIRLRAALTTPAATPPAASAEDVNDLRDVRDTFGGETDCEPRRAAFKKWADGNDHAARNRLVGDDFLTREDCEEMRPGFNAGFDAGATRAAPPQAEPPSVTDAMVDAYLTANDAYWRATDNAPLRDPSRWRNGTPKEATRVSLMAALALTTAQAEPPTGFRVGVSTMETSAGPDYIVTIDRPGRPLDAMPWDAGRMTPTSHKERAHADLEAQAWREFFSGSDKRLVDLIEPVAQAEPPKDSTSLCNWPRCECSHQCHPVVAQAEPPTCWACGGTGRITTSSNGSGLIEVDCECRGAEPVPAASEHKEST